MKFLKKIFTKKRNQSFNPAEAIKNSGSIGHFDKVDVESALTEIELRDR